MAFTTLINKTTRRRFRDWLKSKFSPSTSTRIVDENNDIEPSAAALNNPSDIIERSEVASSETSELQLTGLISLGAPEGGQARIDSPSVIRSTTHDSRVTTSSSTTTELAIEECLRTATVNATDGKGGIGMGFRFIQTLLKKLPDCVDVNPVKMALSIVKTIIIIKDEIGDNNDALTDGLKTTELLLSDAIGKVQSEDLENVKLEMENYKMNIGEQNTQLLQISRELDFKLWNIDYENYKKKIDRVCTAIKEITNMFMLQMQIEIRKATAIIHEQIKEEQKARLSRSLQDLKPSAKANHKTVINGHLKREACTEGTRVKILEEITKWANDPAVTCPRVFWLTGQAGSGKTTIAYTITRKFEKGQPTSLGANFLCSRQFEETRSLNRILPTIAYQLAYKCEPYEAALHANVVDKSAVVEHDLSEQLQELLVVPWSNCVHPFNRSIYLIVIDALDEIDDGSGSILLSNLLMAICEYGLEGLKLLITSRTDPKILKLCEAFTSRIIVRLQDISIHDTKSDIKTYLETMLPALANGPKLSDLVERANGLFIYAATIVKILGDPQYITSTEQSEILHSFLSKSLTNPDTSPVDELYKHILYKAFCKFHGNLLDRRLLILHSFLCAAERISPSVASILTETEEEIAQSVVDALHSVIYLQDGRVFWYHASFPDFMFSKSQSNFRFDGKDYDFWCNAPVHHSLLAASCFRIMQSPSGLRFNIGDISSSFIMDCDDTNNLSSRINKNITPALRYSCFSWATHTRLSPLPILTDNDLYHLIMVFLQVRVLFWIETMNLLGSLPNCSPVLYRVRDWVLSSKLYNNDSTLARDLQEAAHFVTYFAGSPAAESTPHLYISSLATWKPDSTLLQGWKNHFTRIPAFSQASGTHTLPLLTVELKTELYTVAFSKDSTQIASGSIDGCVRILDASTGKEEKVLRGHTGAVLSVAFSSADKWIASGSVDSTIRIWDGSTGKCLNTLKGHTDIVTSVTISKNGRWIASGSYDNSIRLWDASKGEVKNVLTGHTDPVSSVALSSSGALIASGSYDRSVRIWDTSSGQHLRTMKGHTKMVNSVAFSVDGSWIVSAADDCSVRLWDTATGNELRTFYDHNGGIDSVAISDDRSWMVSGSVDYSICVWDASTGKIFKVLQGHSGWIRSVSLSSDATRIVSASQEGCVQVWEMPLSTSTEHNIIKHYATSPITSVASSHNGSHILWGTQNGSVHLWNTTIDQELQEPKDNSKSVTSVAFAENGTCVAWGLDNTVWVRDVSRSAEVKVLVGHTDDINSIAFSSDGSLVVSSSDDCTVRLWDASKGWELRVMNGHTIAVLSATFSKINHRIVSGSMDGSVRVWDISTGQTLKVIEGWTWATRSVAFSNDAAWVASGLYDGSIRLCEVSTGNVLKVLRGHLKSVIAVAVSSDDTCIVSGSYDGTVRIWDLSTGEELKALRGRHTGYVKSVAFSSDGRFVVSGAADGSVIVWDLEDPSWHLTDTNWIRCSSTGMHLMWIPPFAQIPQRNNCRIVTGDSFYGSINFRNLISVTGFSWKNCYTQVATTPTLRLMRA